MYYYKNFKKWVSLFHSPIACIIFYLYLLVILWELLVPIQMFLDKFQLSKANLFFFSWSVMI